MGFKIMNEMTKVAMNKHQMRTEETRGLLLKAAEELFVRDGYEGAQLTEISSLAGRTKGAVYAHFKNKEDLFLALFEVRTREYLDKLEADMARCGSREELHSMLRGFFVALGQDRNWPILNLEFKLYALRHPQSKERLREAYEGAKLTRHEEVYQKLYGQITDEQKRSMERKAAAVGPIMQGLILESHFEPELLSDLAIGELLGLFYDTLFGGPQPG